MYKEKYLKYKTKYLDLQSQTGGSPIPPQPAAKKLERKKSIFISDQGDYGTCYAHATTRLILKLITTFFNEPYFLGNRSCHYYYSTEICSIDNTIFDCFLQIKNGEKDCNNSQNDKKEIDWPEENFYALLFHFIFSIVVKQFGYEGGKSAHTSFYILDYLKDIDITADEIKNTLNYNENKYVTDKIDYFNKLITDSVELFKDVKENLNNEIFNPIFYVNLGDIAQPIKYRKNNNYNIGAYNPRAYHPGNITSIKNNISEFTKTDKLQDNIKYVLDHNYYALLSTNEHVVIITNCFGSKDDLTLEIKNSHGLDAQLSCKWVSRWCKLINDNKIKLNELLEWTEDWTIMFFYPYEFIDQKDIEKEFNENTSLKYLYIGLDKGMALARVLMQNTTIKSLYIDGCDIGTLVTIAIAGALKKNKTLTTLDLRNNYIGADGAVALAEALEKNKTLITLDLRHRNNYISNTIKNAIHGKDPRIIVN